MKKSFIQQLFATLVAVSMVCSVLCISAMGYSTEKGTSKIECNATVDDAFASDRIIIVFTQEASLTFKEYSIDSFPEIDCKSVLGLSTAIDSMAKQALYSVEKAITNNQTPIIDNKLNLSDFHTIISVELNSNSKSNVLESIEKLQNRKDILFVCPDYEIKFVEDTYTYQSEGTGDMLYTDPEVINDLLGITAVHDLLRSRELSYESTPIVAVIDSGITHGSFGNRIVDHLSFDFSDFNGIYYPGDDLTVPKDILERIKDDKGHGTHVGGIIKSVVEYDEYMNIQFSSIKVSEYDPTDNDETHVSQVISAINYVNDLNIPLINISGTTQISPTQMDFSELFRIAVAGYQGLMICAAGNKSQYLETETEDDDLFDNDIYPAALIMDNLITVASCDLNGNKSTISNWGNKNVDLFAPGENILSTYSTIRCNHPNIQCSSLNTPYNIHLDIDVDGDGNVDSGYHSITGTSMAAPFVTGVAAMLLAIDDTLSPETIREIIIESVDPCIALQDKCVSGGRLNAYNAVVALMSNCSHTGVSYSNNGSTHTLYCNTCNYQRTEPHNLYVENIGNMGRGCTIGCRECSYSFDCDCCPEYLDTGSAGHYADCPDGNFHFFEEHNYGYRNTSSDQTHQKICDDCGYVASTEAHTFRCENVEMIDYHLVRCQYCDYSYREDHLWMKVGQIGNRCLECNMYTNGSVRALTDDELRLYLSKLSKDELEVLIANLHEDLLPSITALLPREMDEILTE